MKRILIVSQHFWPEPFRINDIVEGFIEDGLKGRCFMRSAELSGRKMV